jgi:hypothetical protein
MYMLGHHHITCDVAAVPAADSLEFSLAHCEGIVIPNDIPPSRKKREKGGATPNWELNLKGWASPQQI